MATYIVCMVDKTYVKHYSLARVWLRHATLVKHKVMASSIIRLVKELNINLSVPHGDAISISYIYIALGHALVMLAKYLHACQNACDIVIYSDL